MSAEPTALRPEVRAAELLAAIEAVIPDLGGPALLDLLDGLARLECSVLRRALVPAAPPPAPREPEPDPVLTLDEAAVYLRHGKSWVFHCWRRLHLGFRSGRRVLFRRSTLDRYLSACERRSRS